MDVVALFLTSRKQSANVVPDFHRVATAVEELYESYVRASRGGAPGITPDETSCVAEDDDWLEADVKPLVLKLAHALTGLSVALAQPTIVALVHRNRPLRLATKRLIGRLVYSAARLQLVSDQVFAASEACVTKAYSLVAGSIACLRQMHREASVLVKGKETRYGGLRDLDSFSFWRIVRHCEGSGSGSGAAGVALTNLLDGLLTSRRV
jgi:hypothetical protein